MVTLRKRQVEEIRSAWRGNGGDKTLYEITQSYGLTVNEAYSVLSSVEFEAIRRANHKNGWKVHAYREVA